MTTEEALKILDTIPTISKQVDALEMAIKALERASCIKEKCAYCPHCEHCDVDDETLAIKALEPCEDCISRQAVLEQARDYGSNTYLIPVNSVKTLPSVKPTRPTARWERFAGDYNKCSKCGKLAKFYFNYEYCPGCGAKMQEVEE